MPSNISPEVRDAARRGLALWEERKEAYLASVPPDDWIIDHKPHKALSAPKLASACPDCLRRRIDWMCTRAPWTVMGMKGRDLHEKYKGIV